MSRPLLKAEPRRSSGGLAVQAEVSSCERRRCCRCRAGTLSLKGGYLVGMLGAPPQDAAEMLRIMRFDEMSRARQIEVVQARQPEAKSGGAQHQRPGTALGHGERAHRAVGVQKRAGLGRVD